MEKEVLKSRNEIFQIFAIVLMKECCSPCSIQSQNYKISIQQQIVLNFLWILITKMCDLKKQNKTKQFSLLKNDLISKNLMLTWKVS